MMQPGQTSSPPNLFTPSRFPGESWTFCVEPPLALWAIPHHLLNEDIEPNFFYRYLARPILGQSLQP